MSAKVADRPSADELRAALKGVNRDIAKEVRAAVGRGWRLKSGSRHLQLFSADGVSIVTVSRTPQDPKVVKKIRAQLRGS